LFNHGRTRKQCSDVAFHYRQPLAVSAGLAYSAGRGAIELDVKHYAGTDTYDLLSSMASVQRTIAGGQSVVVDAVPFPALSYTARPVTNLAAGGSFRFNDALTVHGGVYNDRSPVGEEGASPVFTRMNLTGVTAGASVNILRVVGSAGIAYAWGQQPIAFDSAMGSVHSTIGLRSLQLFYAFSVSF
jgi:long-subunit fatty acid transport protein